MCRKRYSWCVIRAFLLVVLTLTCTYALGATLYVSKDGNDANPGTRSEPLLKIQDAIDASKKNGRIIVGPGKYIENLEIIVKADTKLAGSGEIYEAKRRAEIYHAWDNSTSHLNFVTKLHMAGF